MPRIIAYFSILLILIFSCSGRGKLSPNDIALRDTITNRIYALPLKADSFDLGLLGKHVETTPTTFGEELIKLERGIVLINQEKEITSFWIRDSRFSTSRGIRIDDTLDLIKTEYGDSYTVYGNQYVYQFYNKQTQLTSGIIFTLTDGHISEIDIFITDGL